MCPRASISLKRIKNQEHEICECCNLENNENQLESLSDGFDEKNS